MDIIRKKGFDFGFDPSACERCPGTCCRGEPGYIWASHHEILQISIFLHVHPIDFTRKYLNWIGNRWSIQERYTGLDYECVFFGGPEKKCTIYKVRPVQCRQFPFWEHYKRHKDQVMKECPGIRE